MSGARGPGYDFGYWMGRSIAGALTDIVKAEMSQKVDARTRANLRFSEVLTEAVRLTKSGDRRELGRELRRFLELSANQEREELYAVWLNLKAMADTGEALGLADRYGLDPYDTGQALLTGYGYERTESLAHLAGVTGQMVYPLVIQALTIDANGAKKHGAEAVQGTGGAEPG
jgi:hypothetical protein